MCLIKPTLKKTQAQTRTAEAAPLDCRSGALMDQSLSPFACPLGKEGFQLLVIAVLRLRYHLLAQM